MTTPKQALDYVRGTVNATEQFIPALKNYAIRDNMIQGSDSVVTLNARIETELPAMCIDAQKLVSAIFACEDDEIELSVTDAHNLRVKAGNFRAIVPATMSADSFPWAAPSQTTFVKVPEQFLDALRTLSPFIGSDATRRYSLSVLIDRDFLYATNNVIMVRVPLDERFDIEPCAIPQRAINELLRVETAPKFAVRDDDALTFYHAKSWWLRTQLVTDPWPNILPFFENDGSTLPALSEELRNAVVRLSPFCASASPVYIRDGMVTTSIDDDEGAAVSGIESIRAAFTITMLRRALASATHFDFTAYPKPCRFSGPGGLEGVIATYTMPTRGPEAQPPVPPKRSAKR